MRIETHEDGGWTIRTASKHPEGSVARAAGLSWDRDQCVWRTTKVEHIGSLIDLAAEHGIEVTPADVAQKLREASDQAQATKAQALAASRALDADIDIPVPEGLDYLPFQRAGIAYMRDRRDVIEADEMGLGKTIQVLGLMNLVLRDVTKVNVLVIAPLIALRNWQVEVERWLVKPHRIAIWTTKKQDDADIVIVNYDIASKLGERLQTRTWDYLVCDEAHALKNDKAARTIAILGDGGKSHGIQAHHRIFVTGTPILNRPVELYPILHACDVDYARSYGQYTHRYCNGHHTAFGYDASGASNLDELQQRLRSTLMVRRLKAEVLTELPAKRHQLVLVEPFDAAMRKALRAEAAEIARQKKAEGPLLAAVQKAKAGEDKAAHKTAVEKLRSAKLADLALIARLRHDTALAKIPAVIEHVRGILDADSGAVLIFAHHRDVIEALHQAFEAIEFPTAVIHGDTSAADRQSTQDDIQSGRKRVFIGSITACGVAITLTAASFVVFAEVDWTPGRMAQAEDRAHRIGQTNPVLVQHLAIDESIDAHMLQQLAKKGFVIDKAMGDDFNEANFVTIEHNEIQELADPIMEVTKDDEAAAMDVDEVARLVHPTSDPTERHENHEKPTSRLRGRPTLGEQAMTAAERARRYRAARRVGEGATVSISHAIRDRLAAEAAARDITVDSLVEMALAALGAAA